ncbi:rod-binding protein [Chelativorans alearense]|uniref:rod-binding protein n=1 Tax=Chelativorans alearense TaxID=2681495 RepID=UPI0013D65AD5|nr:rod-binding protein [Chelativorans alearense]
MAISPPGDILLDVAKAADPAKVEAARARLRAHAGDAATAFEVAAPTPRAQNATAGRPEHFVEFESMVLQSFLQNMLPEDTAAFYGEGLSGEMWRGLLAQELGNVMARRGGIGIADRVLGDHTLEDGRKVPVAGVSSGPEAKEAATQASLAASLIEEIERQTAKTLAADAAPPSTHEE